jgi:hypothetical protein
MPALQDGSLTEGSFAIPDPILPDRDLTDRAPFSPFDPSLRPPPKRRRKRRPRKPGIRRRRGPAHGQATSGTPGSGARGLLLAVLEDAIRCMNGEGSPCRDRARLASEARRWIVSRDEQWPFSFENVCHWLGLPAGRLRRHLLDRATALDDGLDDDGVPHAAYALSAGRNAEL